MKDNPAKAIYIYIGKFLSLGVFIIAALVASGVYALTIQDVNITYNGQTYDQLPVDFGYVNKSFEITINATADGVANWTIVILNETKDVVKEISIENKTDKLSNKVVTINVSGLSDGKYYINLTAVNPDNVDDNATKELGNFTLDTTPPSINISAGSYNFGQWTNQNVTLYINATDNFGIANITLYRNGTIYSWNNTNFTVTLSEEGVWEIDVEVIDLAGNKANETGYKVLIDKTPPNVNVSCNDTPLSNNTWYNTSLSCEVITNDALSGVNKTEIILDGTIVNESLFNITTEGWHNLTVRVLDKAGNSVELYYEFGIDLHAPTIISVNYSATRSYVDNSNRTWVAGTINITYNVSDNESAIKIVKLLIDGGIYTNSTNTSDLFIVDTTNLSSNTNHTFELEVCDLANNCNKSKIAELWIDNEAPQYEIIYPKTYGQTYYINNTNTETWTNIPNNITVRVLDNGVGINWTATHLLLDIYLANNSYTQLRETNYTIYNKTDHNGTIVVNVTEVLQKAITTHGEGKYEFKEINIYDLFGNYNYTYRTTSGPFYTIIYDTTTPNITLVNITKQDGVEANYLNGKYYINSTNAKVYINVTDNLAGVSNVSAYIDGTEINVTNLTDVYVIELTNLTDGEYNIVVTAIDEAGNVNQLELTIVIDTTAPGFVGSYYITPRKVKIEFSENVRINVKPFNITLLNPDGTNRTETVNPEFDNESYIRDHEVVLKYPVTIHENLTIEFCDMAGNCVTINVTPKNAPDRYLVLPVGEWTYIAFDYEVDTGYELWRMVVDRTGFNVGIYLGGGWRDGKDKFGKMLYGYAIYVDKAVDEGFDTEILPIKVLPIENVTTTVIQLKEGWNLIGVYDTRYGNGATNTTLSIVDTTLNSLRTETGSLVFAYIAKPTTSEIVLVGGILSDYLPITFTEWKPYWILIPNLISRDYVNYWAPITPGNPSQ